MSTSPLDNLCKLTSVTGTDSAGRRGSSSEADEFAHFLQRVAEPRQSEKTARESTVTQQPAHGAQTVPTDASPATQERNTATSHEQSTDSSQRDASETSEVKAADASASKENDDADKQAEQDGDQATFSQGALAVAANEAGKQPQEAGKQASHVESAAVEIKQSTPEQSPQQKHANKDESGQIAVDTISQKAGGEPGQTDGSNGGASDGPKENDQTKGGAIKVPLVNGTGTEKTEQGDEAVLTSESVDETTEEDTKPVAEKTPAQIVARQNQVQSGSASEGSSEDQAPSEASAKLGVTKTSAEAAARSERSSNAVPLSTDKQESTTSLLEGGDPDSSDDTSSLEPSGRHTNFDPRIKPTSHGSITDANTPHGSGAAHTNSSSSNPGPSGPVPHDLIPTADRGRFVQRVANAFRTAHKNDGHIQLRLSPPELGSLRIEISVRNGVLTANLETETSDARRVVLDNLPALRQRLADQEIRIDRFQVDVRRDGGQPGGQSSWQDQRPHQTVRTNTTIRNSVTADLEFTDRGPAQSVVSTDSLDVRI